MQSFLLPSFASAIRLQQPGELAPHMLDAQRAAQENAPYAGPSRRVRLAMVVAWVTAMVFRVPRPS